MEALIRRCGCTSKSSLEDFFLCCGPDYVVYIINGRICRESERERKRERDVIPFVPKVVIPALPKSTDEALLAVTT